MAKKEQSSAKVNLGVRVAPAMKARLEEIAVQISKESYPAAVTAAELAGVAIAEYIERYERAQTRG